MVLLVGGESKNEDEEVFLKNQVSLFIVGDGGLDGPRFSVHTIDITRIHHVSLMPVLNIRLLLIKLLYTG